jgi:hypothetical protein
MEPKVLITDLGGMPRDWVPLREGANYHVRGKVVFTIGDVLKTYLGGHNAEGEQSRVDVQAILGCTGPLMGEKWLDRTTQYTERKILYARDRWMCAYCGRVFAEHKLTIDHVTPSSRGGQNIWMNTVTCCKPCNSSKANKTPEEADMPLLYLPYVPNMQEKMILKERHVLVDQMKFLMERVPKTSRLWKDYKPV